MMRDNVQNGIHRIVAWGLACLLLCGLAGCGSETMADRISEVTGLPSGVVQDSFDNHGGFHGDGIAYAVVTFPDSAAERAIAQNPDWKPYPLDDTLQALLYGVTTASESSGPYVTDDDGTPLFPEISDGYYVLLDRYEESAPGHEEDILHRASFNFTVAIYDKETRTLYYAEMDT